MSQSSAPETKKPYETPTVTKVGSVEEVTKGAAGGLPDVSFAGSQ